MVLTEDALGLTTGLMFVSEAQHRLNRETVQALLAEPQHSTPMFEDDSHE